MTDEEKYPLALKKGTVLAGRFIIDKVLGQGGFGITYRATDHSTNTYVAIKEYFPESFCFREKTAVISYTGERTETFEYGKSNFLEEAKTLSQFIGHENIVRIYSYFEENGTAYFVMEYIEGVSFDVFLKQKGGKISVPEAEGILLPIMDALAAVHSKGIVHRDVTPDNIYICNDGTIKLLDFGAARYSLGDKSRSLDVILKHGFAPKEQYIRRGKQGPFTDVYSLGATFYFAITGKRPPDSVERMEEELLIPPSSMGVDITTDKEDAILKAMEIMSQNRFQTMEEFKEALLKKSIYSDDSGRTMQVPNPPVIPTIPLNNYNSETVPADNEEEKGSKKKIIILISALAAVIGIIVLVVALVLGGNNNSRNNSDKSVGAEEDKENEPTEAPTSEATPTSVPTQESTPTSTPDPTATPDPTQVPVWALDWKEGDILTFGSYEQDNDLSNGSEPIEWIVLSNDGEKLLLLSKYVLDSKAYNNESKSITWEKCTLRAWLNDSFYNEAFNSEEKSVVRLTSLSNKNNPSYGTKGGNDTEDYVFLLSMEDTIKYGFSSDYEERDINRRCGATAYALAQGVFTTEQYKDDEDFTEEYLTFEGDFACWWWLRTPGSRSDLVAGMFSPGYVDVYGDFANRDVHGVRPAIYLNLNP